MLDNDKETILAYMEQNIELKYSPYIIYDLPLPDSDKNNVEFVVMAINPGESARNWKYLNDVESFKNKPDGSYFVTSKGRRQSPWSKQIKKFCGTDNVVQTEAFFWSTKSIKDEDFKDRFGYSFKSKECQKHLVFCKQLNQERINFYNPKALVVSGLGLIKQIADLYNLKPSRTIKCPEKGHRLIETFRCDQDRPWIFTKHWSNSRGFTENQKDIISNYITRI